MPSSIYDEIGKRIRRQRILLELSQEQLAERSKISASFMGHIERGEKKPSLETIIRICEGLNLSLDFIIYGINGCESKKCPLLKIFRKEI